jgi:hypothetical protein
MASSNVSFDWGKFRAAVLHIIGGCDSTRLGAVKLHKVLYYSDMMWFIETGKAITGADYRKRPFGPTCDALLPLLKDLENEQLIQIENVEYYGYAKKQFTLLGNSESNVLSADEKAVLDEISDFVCNNNSAKTISDFSHDMVWDMVEYGEVIPYHNAIHLIPNDIAPSTLEWAEDLESEIEDSRRKSKGAVLAFKDVRTVRDGLA